MNLTEEEKRELETYPVSNNFVPQSPEQFAMRLSIAKKFCAYALENDSTLTPEMRAIYEQYPLWGFYESADYRADDASTYPIPRRSYGVMKVHDAESGEPQSALHMVTAHFFWVNDVVGGVTTSEVTRVDQWSDRAKDTIRFCLAPGIFLDPLGFLIPVRQHAK